MNSFSSFIVIILSAFSMNCLGQLNSAQTVAAKVESERYKTAIAEAHRLIDSIQQNENIPGLDAAVSINGETVWSEGFGFADLEHKVKVIPGITRFRIGSVSKPLTAAAMGKLVDKGKLNLDATIQTYVPYFPLKKYPVTVRQVAGHLSGIRHYKDNEFLIRDHYNSVKSSIDIFANDSLLFEPGSRFSYSSYGFNLLSAVVEGASGDNFLRFMQQEVFSPLGMNSTCADINDSIIVNRTSFYQFDSILGNRNATYVDNSYKWAGGGFISTTADLIKFGEAHLTPGFLSETALKELTTSLTLSNGDSTGYGIGWSILNKGTLQGYGHNGGSVGGITAFRIYPKEKLVIVLLSNSSNTDYGNVVDRIVEAFAKEYER